MQFKTQYDTEGLDMRYQQYKFNFYLNARHAIFTNGKLGEIHPHTWEIILYVARVRGAIVQFHELEQSIEACMEKYQSSTLNEIEPFDVINPTLENCANYFKDQFSSLLNEQGWILLMMEMSETPSRSYVLSMVDELELGKNQTINALTDAMLEDIANANIKEY